MRDFFSHSELLLAGMWGGSGGVFKDIIADMIEFIATGNFLGDRVVDQHFLRFCVWPTVRQSVIMHDSFFSWRGGIPFPGEFDIPWFGGPQFHIGANLGSVHISSQVPEQYQELVWHIVDKEGNEQLAYKASVINGVWKSELPGYIAKRVQENGWLIKVKLFMSVPDDIQVQKA